MSGDFALGIFGQEREIKRSNPHKMANSVKAQKQGSWGIKVLPLFSQALVAKGMWRVLSSEDLWKTLIKRKYIKPLSLEKWIRCPKYQWLVIQWYGML
jgi:hypothetical protein